MPRGFAKKKGIVSSKEAEPKADPNIQERKTDDTYNTNTFIVKDNSELTDSEENLPLSPSNTGLLDEDDVLAFKSDKNTSTKDHHSELEFLMEDVRKSLKEKSLIDSSSQVLPDSAYQKDRKTPKFLQKIEGWMSEKVRVPYPTYKPVSGSKKKRSPTRILFLLLLLVGLGYILLITKNKLDALSPVVIPTYTPVPTYSIPIPFSIQFPGGWTFLLATSKNVYPDWKPLQAEWLDGTVICKLIAIPWNKQIDAVYKTLFKGDKIILNMSNQDQSTYQIETLETISKDDLLEKVNSNSPCMIIFLYKDGSINNQVLLSLPSIP